MIKKTRLLSVFVVFLFIGSLAATGVNAYVSVGHTDADLMIPAETYGDDRRNEAVSILIYSEIADTTAGEEWENVMDSLIANLEGKFTYKNLTDYTQLGSMIDEFDVLLILESENGNYTFADTVNAAWAGILPGFVADGGIAVCMTYGPNSAMRGVSLGIINGTLIDTYNPSTAYTHQIDLFDSNDALARNVPASYTGASGSLGFDAPGVTKVMEDNTNSKPVVVHKIMGKGHVVVLGFDMFTAGIVAQDMLLKNAILLHRHIVFDNSHSQGYSITGEMSEIANDLPYYGFSVSSIDTFDSDVLAACDIFVITYAGAVYNTTEIEIIHDFVSDGGGLFISTEITTYGDELDDLINDFGFVRNTTHDIEDSDEFSSIYENYPRFAQPDNFEIHSATINVDVMEFYTTTGFISMPSSAIPLVVTDSDGTATWGGIDSAAGVPIAAANLVGEGRIIVLGDTAPFRNTDLDSDGSSSYTDSDNELFLRNSFRWLSAAGIPEQTVLFDQSHGPWGYISSTWNALANFLIFNGYNVEYMPIFSPEAYEDSDILVICDGTVDYNATELAHIEGYVAGGGGLLLWGDVNALAQQVDPIAQEFGIHVNTTGTLHDSDDYVSGTNYIIWDGNNIKTHPITDGVERLEVYSGGALISMATGSVLVSTDGDGTTTWNDGTPAISLPVYGATTHNQGRVVYLSDIDLGRIVDGDGDGFGCLYDSDNPIFVANVFKWLAENRAPIVEVLSPNGGELLNGTITISWDAVDYDSDPMTYDVFVSDNNGSDWSLLATGLSVPEYEWNTTQHDDGNSYMILVEASDGVLQGQDTSDNPFELDNFVAPPGPGFPIDPMLLALIGAGVIVIVLILVILSKKKGGGTE